MSKENYIPRLRLIINRLERGPATYDQINSFLERESVISGEDYVISLRTLQRDISFINSKLDYEIVNERVGEKRYLIKSRPETSNLSNRLLESYQMINLIKLSQNFSDHIFLETRHPKGLEHFPQLHYSITSKLVCTFEYYKYWDETIQSRIVHPIALKEARGRWYLLAEDQKDLKLKTFGLDRMENLEVGKKTFKTARTYNIEELFENTFGILNDERIKPQKVVLQFNYEQGQYIKNYPLHSSQVTVQDEDETITFELFIRVTYDFVMEILSYGKEVKVMKPASLVKEVCEKIDKTLNHYNKGHLKK